MYTGQRLRVILSYRQVTDVSGAVEYSWNGQDTHPVLAGHRP